MKLDSLNRFVKRFSERNRPVPQSVPGEGVIEVYPRSVRRKGGDIFFMARSSSGKHLYLMSDRDGGKTSGMTDIDRVYDVEKGMFIKRCPLIHGNACALRELFSFTKPSLLGTVNSFGLGDRLGIAGPGHIRALVGSDLKPVIAQQSIRELERTCRTPEDVLDAASWAVFQEGYTSGFGADADHLKTTEDIDSMARAGFTMFTFDPGGYVDIEAGKLGSGELLLRAGLLDWAVLEDDLDSMVKRYESNPVRVNNTFTIAPTGDEVLRGVVKYGKVIVHALKLYRHLDAACSGKPYEVELSVDETDSPTTPFEHYFMAGELKRLGVKLTSLAPRFIGDFEKGVDYKGDLALFEREYGKHLAIAQMLGSYKLSLHSGSDKFSVYKIIGTFDRGSFHVKTAGTSYLVALETAARFFPELFREILDFSRGLYETEKRSYHVSARIGKVPPADSLSDDDLIYLFSDNDARQVLHVTFGKVLTARNDNGNTLFKDRLMECLTEHEEDHYSLLQKHITRHLEAFKA